MMGLDLSHGQFRCSYGSFSVWRNALLDAAGYTWNPVHRMEYIRQGLAAGQAFPLSPAQDRAYDIDWSALKLEHYQGEWGAMPVRITGEPDPLLMVICHSDCDGKLKREFLPAIAERLEGLIDNIATSVDPFRNHVEMTRRFVAACREAHEAGVDLEFW